MLERTESVGILFDRKNSFPFTRVVQSQGQSSATGKDVYVLEFFHLR